MASALVLLKKNPSFRLEARPLDLPWPGRPRVAPAPAPVPQPWPLPPTWAVVLNVALRVGLTQWLLR